MKFVQTMVNPIRILKNVQISAAKKKHGTEHDVIYIDWLF